MTGAGIPDLERGGQLSGWRKGAARDEAEERRNRLLLEGKRSLHHLRGLS